jgi:hypothetical protein
MLRALGFCATGSYAVFSVVLGQDFGFDLGRGLVVEGAGLATILGRARASGGGDHLNGDLVTAKSEAGESRATTESMMKYTM